jgi:GNAT superfamily N-acetyltransferase
VIQGFFKGGRPALSIQAHPGAGPGVPGRAPVAQPFSSGHAFRLPSTVSFAAHGGGQPLPAAVLGKMEDVFGTSFADVRVHVGPQAASIGAVAFTMGSDLYFAPGQYDSHSVQGQRLLAHELTHVVQQRAGRVRNPLGGGVAVVQDPALEAEAERMGMRAGTPSAGAAVQAPMPEPGLRALGRFAPGAVTGGNGAAQAYLVQPPAQSPSGRLQIRVTLPGSAGEVGSVNVRPMRSGLLEITDLYVAPGHRRRGLGKRLMQAALRAARGQGLTGAVLEARPSDRGISAPALQAMYERMGFRTVRLSPRGNAVMQFGTGAARPRVHRPLVVQRMKVVKALWHDYGSRTAKQGAKVFRIKLPDLPPPYGLPPGNWQHEGLGESNNGLEQIGEAPLYKFDGYQQLLQRNINQHEQVTGKNKIDKMFSGSGQIREPRSYEHDPVRQPLRWLATVLLNEYGGVEVQCYYHGGKIYVSSNQNAANVKMDQALKADKLIPEKMSSPNKRIRRHFRKLLTGLLNKKGTKYQEQAAIMKAIRERKIEICPVQKRHFQMHAERTIQQYLNIKLDPKYLAGTKRPCMACAVALGFSNDSHPGPIWTTKAGCGGHTLKDIMRIAEEMDLYSYVTLTRDGILAIGVGTDSERDSDSESDSDSD